MTAPEPTSPIDSTIIRTAQETVAAPDRKIGVLFVHGMGEQQRGGTLQGWAEPLVQWIRRWDSREFRLEYVQRTEPAPWNTDDPNQPAPQGGGQASADLANSPLGYTVIRGEPANPGVYEPATTQISMSRPGAGDGQPLTATWVMAEAWWADAFYPPPFSQLAKWGLGVGPRFVVRHFEMEHGGLAGKPQFLRYGVALALVLALELLVMLLLIVGALPFARNYVRTIILRLIGSVGDPMVLVSSPLRSAALSTAVRNALGWLERQGCQRIAVIAHSLGTVVSYNVLSTNSTGVDLFVTFGAALKKSHLLQRVQNNDVRLSLGVVLSSAAFACLALAGAIGAWFWVDEEIARFNLDLLGWTWPQVLMVGGAMLCIARLALWRTDGPRVVAPLGCLIALIGAIAFLAYRPTASSPVGLDELSFSPIRDFLTSRDFLRITPFLAAFASSARRELHDLTILRSGNADRIRELEQKDHPPLIGSILIQSLLIGGTWAACVTQWWRPPEFIAPLIVTGLVLAYSAIRVPFGNGYLPGDRETNMVPFLFASTGIRASPLEWQDYWASRDPVPEGGFERGNVDGSPRPVDLASNPVTNDASVIADHTAYNHNLEEFVGPVVDRLCALTGWASPWQDATDAQVMTAAQARREARVRERGRAGLVLLLSLVAAMLYMTFWQLERLTQLGNAALTPLLGLLNLILSDDLVGNIDEVLPGGAIGLFLIFLAGMLWQRFVTGAAWRHWERAEQSAMFQRIAITGFRAPFWIRWRHVAFCVAGAMPVLLAGAFIWLVASGKVLGGS